MKIAISTCLVFAVIACAPTLRGATTLTTSESTFFTADLAEQISGTDLIQGLIATEFEDDTGWHPDNTDPADWLPAFTDGNDFSASGLQGLLNDFPGEGTPTKHIQYTLAEPKNLAEIRVFSGNLDADGRVFQTYTVEFSSDNGNTFSDPIYVESHPLGTLNNRQLLPTPGYNEWESVLTQLGDDTGLLAVGVTDIVFSFYAVDNTGGQYRDPYGGVNPFTGVDDTLTFAFVSPLILEIDVIESFVQPPLPGDGNGDGWVNGIDYLIWADHFNTHPGPDGDPSDGDYNDDGWVTGLDYLLWAGNFGSHNVSTAVPEPGGALLIALGAVVAVHGRFRVRQG